jgi:hypothetical protein
MRKKTDRLAMAMFFIFCLLALVSQMKCEAYKDTALIPQRMMVR